MEEYIESIFGCLERIENKINGQSAPLPEGNSPTVNNEKDESVLNEVRNDHETFRKLLARVYEGLAAIKNDMVSMDRKNSSQEWFPWTGRTRHRKDLDRSCQKCIMNSGRTRRKCKPCFVRPMTQSERMPLRQATSTIISA